MELILKIGLRIYTLLKHNIRSEIPLKFIKDYILHMMLLKKKLEKQLKNCMNGTHQQNFLLLATLLEDHSPY